MNKRVLILTQYFPPEIGAPQARLWEIAKTMVAHGWSVQVLTAMPNYPHGVIQEAYKGKWLVREEMDGIQVIRTAIYPTKNASFIPRLTNYFSFVISSVLQGMFYVKRPMAVICESPPLFLGLSGIFYKFFLRTRLVMNISDLWPETMVSMGMIEKGPLLSMAEFLEKMCYRFSNCVTGQSRGIIKGVVKAFPRARVVHIPNGCDCEFFTPDKRDDAFAEEHDLGDKILVGYAGLLGLAQGVGIMLDLAVRFKDEDRLLFTIVGDGPERAALEKRIADEGLTNVRMTGSVPKHRMPGIVPLFDMFVIPLRYVIPGAVPSKIYETMACQVPILLLAQGEPRDLVTRAEAGIPADYDNLDEICAAIRKLLNDEELRKTLGENGRRYALEHHHRPRIAEKLMASLESLERGDLRSELDSGAGKPAAEPS